MRIVFLLSTRQDLRWFRRYYEEIFSEGARQAAEQYDRTLEALASHPRLGHPSPVADVREFSIPRTSFPLIYRIRDDRIEILRVFDERSER